MDVQINKKNGESFTLEQYGILVKDFIVSSIPLEPVYGSVEGSDRKIDYGANYGTRTITVPFRIQAYDLMDFPLLRDVLFDLVVSKESFYVREMRRAKKLSYAFVDPTEPARMDPDTDNRLVGGKRYLVRLQDTFDLDQVEADGEGELIFETTELPFAESIGTTQDIQRNGINAEDGLWGFGMGLEAIDETLIYKHNAVVGKTFRIFNAGNVPIYPFEQELKITISNVVGSTERFQITNLTNGSRSRIDVPLKQTDKVIYDGPNVTRNSLAFLRDTRKDFIELSPGWNNFQIYYCDRATVEFDFRFYYL